MKKVSSFLCRQMLAPLVISAIIMNFVGCVGYRVGSMLPPKYKTVAVPTFLNETAEPLLENQTTSAAIAKIQADGSLRVADIGTADAVLRVTLKQFELRPIAFSDDRARLANEYRMHITAAIVLADRITGEVVVESPSIQGFADFIVTGDLSSSKQATLPDASSDLAHKIVERIVEVW